MCSRRQGFSSRSQEGWVCAALPDTSSGGFERRIPKYKAGSGAGEPLTSRFMLCKHYSIFIGVMYTQTEAGRQTGRVGQARPGQGRAEQGSAGHSPLDPPITPPRHPPHPRPIMRPTPTPPPPRTPLRFTFSVLTGESLTLASRYKFPSFALLDSSHQTYCCNGCNGCC